MMFSSSKKNNNSSNSVSSRIWMLLLSMASSSYASDCGGAFTQRCNPDIRYEADEFINLVQQAPAWGALSGFYKVEPYFFLDSNTSGAELLLSETDQIFPFIGYVNISVQGTRYYFHATYIIKDNVQIEKSYAVYREYFGHSTFEKDGIAKLLPDLIQDPVEFPRGAALPVEKSTLQPQGSSTLTRRTKYTIPVRNLIHENEASSTDVARVFDKITCPMGTRSCESMSFTTEFSNKDNAPAEIFTGTYTKYVNETQWMADLLEAYQDNQIPQDQQKPVPMVGDCLIGRLCYQENDFCESGDPACGHEFSSYQQEDGELTSGAKGSIAYFVIAVVVAGAVVAYLVMNMLIERRYRTKFASRFAEDLSLHRAMKDITPENMNREFTFIDKAKKGFITKGELFDFMKQAKVDTPASDSDCTKIWGQMDVNKTGTVSYLEFCMFTADCYREHSMLRNKVLQNHRKAHEKDGQQ